MTTKVPKNADEFRGWPETALEFYAQLEVNNNRPFWLANKATYDEAVRAPFDALSARVEAKYGPLRLFRPNRDVRFSSDKSPYKTAAGAMTETEGGATYYVSISASGLFAGCGMYHLATDQLERWRAALLDNRTGGQITKIVDGLRAQKYEIGAMESLKSAPRGVDKNHPRIDLLRMKGLTAGRTFGAPKWLHTTKAYDKIVEVWDASKAMNDWLGAHVGPSHLPPR